MMRRVLLLLFSVFFLYGKSQPWQQAAGPAGGYVFDLTSSGNNLYAATNAGVFVSGDEGASWTAINSGLPTTQGASRLAADGSNLVLLLNLTRYSDDGGANWNLSLNGAIFENVTKVGHVFFGSGCKGVQKSYNGRQWINASSGIPPKEVDGDNCVYTVYLYGNKLLASTMLGIYHSDTSGVSWSLTFEGETGFRSFAHLGNKLFAGSSNGIYRSLDTGRTWAYVNLNAPDKYINALLAKDSLLFAATMDGLLVSADSGLTWQGAGAGISEPNVQALTVINNSVFAATGTFCSALDSCSLPASISPFFQ
jgi:ligand-binding sensor domain-containing protein